MIYIDFLGGAHGNFLEFVCNKYLAKVPCNYLPFNQLGSSHKKKYHTDKKFTSGHYSDYHGVRTDLYNSKIISINITIHDILPLQSISLLRAGDYNLDNDQLEVNTYNKLNNNDYRWMLDNIISTFFTNQIKDSYNCVRDSSWPLVTNMLEFRALPLWIQTECKDLHNLKLLELTKDAPDCPRYVLREFFKIGFRDPWQSGFISQQEKMVYDISNDILSFPFSCFYETLQFVSEIKRTAKWSGYELDDEHGLFELHKEFLQRQPYKHSKIFCDTIINRIINHETFNFPKLDLMQESYILGILEQHFDKELPLLQNQWFDNSREILDLIVK